MGDAPIVFSIGKTIKKTIAAVCIVGIPVIIQQLTEIQIVHQAWFIPIISAGLVGLLNILKNYNK